jgi:hypothetical protein
MSSHAVIHAVIHAVSEAARDFAIGAARDVASGKDSVVGP